MMRGSGRPFGPREESDWGYSCLIISPPGVLKECVIHGLVGHVPDACDALAWYEIKNRRFFIDEVIDSEEEAAAPFGAPYLRTIWGLEVVVRH